ncbi:CxxH/CxxC protein [Bacillus andreraoultii]|uniref:CxxH/CxxC protein n=1 Tax=Bacillus andreraoultii TaxID=1499685 RepID=UPI00094649C0|nr:CxxH/CxxC protein [Bacillus andreraoultii]
MKIFCCKEHVEYGLEEIINEGEVSPKLEELKESELPTAPCEYCGQDAVYIVSN